MELYKPRNSRPFKASTHVSAASYSAARSSVMLCFFFSFLDTKYMAAAPAYFAVILSMKLKLPAVTRVQDCLLAICVLSFIFVFYNLQKTHKYIYKNIHVISGLTLTQMLSKKESLNSFYTLRLESTQSRKSDNWEELY